MKNCDKDIFENGELVGIFDTTKELAEARCLRATEMSKKYKYDWHYAAGRVVVKRVLKEKSND